jgi:hypothetical protein
MLINGGVVMSLKAMSVSNLKALKRQVEATIHEKIAERRHEIESELLELSRFDVNGRAKVVRAGARGMVARKVGKKLDGSPIANKPKASTPKQRTKTRKARKTRTTANSVAAVPPTLPTVEHIEVLPAEVVPVTSIHANVSAAA